MTLRAKIVLHVVVIHLLLAAVAFIVLWERPSWLFAVEAVFALSILLSIRLTRAFFVPLELIGTGAELISERDFTSRFHPIGQPEMDRLIAVYNRMIDRLREERLQVRERNELLDKIVEASPGGVLLADLDGRVADVNPSASELLGRRREELVGRALGEIEGPLFARLAELAVGEARVFALAGGRRLRARRAAFRDHGFERSFYLLEELTEELQQSERAAYEKLIRMMSHEVNNSVGAVGSLLASVRRGAASLPDGERAELIGALGIAGERLDTLRAFVDRLAEVVRLPEPELRSCDADRLLADVLSLFAAGLEERGIRCEWRQRAPLPAIAMDKNQMERVFVNVIKNAAEAIGERGTIVVRTAVERGVGRVEIEDSGPGLAAEIADQLFTPFFSTKRDGCGLGLTLVKEILGRHRFPFALANAPGGRGARFTLLLGVRGAAL